LTESSSPTAELPAPLNPPSGRRRPLRSEAGGAPTALSAFCLPSISNGPKLAIPHQPRRARAVASTRSDCRPRSRHRERERASSRTAAAWIGICLCARTALAVDDPFAASWETATGSSPSVALRVWRRKRQLASASPASPQALPPPRRSIAAILCWSIGRRFRNHEPLPPSRGRRHDR